MAWLDDNWHLWVPDPNSGCYLWLGGSLDRGYPVVWYKTASIRVYRITCEQHWGPLPKGLERSHTCTNKLCINPEHIVYETSKKNSSRIAPEQRKANSLAAISSMTPEQRKANSMAARGKVKSNNGLEAMRNALATRKGYRY